MKFKYIIVNTYDGMAEGTNDEALAHSFVGDENFFIVYAENGIQMLPKLLDGPCIIPELEAGSI